MLELNKVMLIGNLTRDPELSYLPAGTAVAKMGLAVNRSWKDKTGQWQREASFFDLDAWGPQAEFSAKYLKKGKRVYVEGQLRQNTWEAPDGSKRNQVRIHVERIQFADSPVRPEEQGGETDQAPAAPRGGGYTPRPAAAVPAPQQQPASQQQPFPPFSAGNEQQFPAYGGGAPQENTADDLPF